MKSLMLLTMPKSFWLLKHVGARRTQFATSFEAARLVCSNIPPSRDLYSLRRSFNHGSALRSPSKLVSMTSQGGVINYYGTGSIETKLLGYAILQGLSVISTKTSI